jgi:hypothetical protein
VLLAAGCAGDTVPVTGRLVKDGQPYVARLGGPEPETFAVDFVGEVGGARMVFAAAVNPDGTFSVGGSHGRGVPRGRYRITVLHSGFLGAGGDRLKARFSGDATPLAVDVTDATALTIDVGTGAVTKE